MKTIEVTDGNVGEKVKGSELPVLVYFWADWASSCKGIDPFIDRMAEAYDGSLVIGKINVDENVSMVKEFDIRSIPHFILFVGGEKVGEVNANNKPGIENLLLEHDIPWLL